MSIIVGGVRVGVPHAKVVTWLDDPTVPQLGSNRSVRRTPVRAIVVHTTWGRLGPLFEGSGDRIGRRYVAENVRTTQKSWDFTVDQDGTIYQQNDPARFYTWHATIANPFSVGIEMAQRMDGTLYETQLRATVELVSVLARVFDVPRVVPWRRGAPDLRVLPAVRAGRLGELQGVFGHVHFTDERGPGDPGPFPFAVLRAIGWMGIEWSADGPR
jgi:hypothetical protein